MVLAVSAVACDEPPPAGNPLGDIASSKALLAAAPPAPSQALPPRPSKPVARRANSPSELLLTAKQRMAIEKRYPAAKGFLYINDIEAQLHKKDLARNKAKKAVPVFDKLAKGKWVLFTGHMQDLTDEGFALPVRYTPRAAGDRVGLSESYFPVTLKSIQGFEKAEYQHGELAAVLAKYNGKQTASPGYDLILLRSWFLTGTPSK